MKKEELIEIIYRLEEWYQDRVAALRQTTEAHRIKFESDGKTLELKEKDANAFKLGVKMALEVLGEFPVKITENDE